jgi:NAD(P)-dependent dehydrogenase (short-subunit alcohol dehydrogenase family)
MTGNLEGRVVIVTGAGAGIGHGILRMLIEAGARATGFEVDADRHARVTAEGAVFQQVDVGDVEAFAAAIQEVRRREGRLDGLVNNAGLTLTRPFLELDVAEMDLMWRVNQRSVLVGCQAAARIMVADGRGGALVNIGSNHSQASDREFEAYAGTKGAVAAMVGAMAWSLGGHGIRVNTLSPGLTMTERVSELARGPATDARFRAWHAMEAASTVEEIGRIAVFLLSDASAAITGAEIIADKGMSARLGNLKADDEKADMNGVVSG